MSKPTKYTPPTPIRHKRIVTFWTGLDPAQEIKVALGICHVRGCLGPVYTGDGFGRCIDHPYGFYSFPACFYGISLK